MSQTYYDNIKKPKLQDTHSARDLKNLHICWKIQKRASCPGESTVGVT